MNERANNGASASAKPPAGPTGVVALSAGRAVIVGPAADTRPHAHHALQVVVGLERPIRIRGEAGSKWVTCEAAVVTPDTPHQLGGGTDPLALVYLDPESAEARAAVARLGGTGVHRVESARLEEFRAGALALWRSAPEASADRLIASALAMLVGSWQPPPPLDPRVRAALDLFETLPGRSAPVASIAAAVSLSPGRFAHLFREQTGLAVRRYLLWLRLRDAIEEVAGGSSLTEAAHAAGFSDAAHLTRTFRRMFGVAPSEAFKNCRFVGVV